MRTRLTWPTWAPSIISSPSWYNDNLWVYATIVTVLMGLLGFTIALVTDVILKMIGMEIHKIEHHE